MSEAIYSVDGGFLGYSPGHSEVQRASKAWASGDVGLCATCSGFTSSPKDAAGNRYCDKHNARSGTYAEGLVRIQTAGDTVHLYANDRLLSGSAAFALLQSGYYGHGSLARVRCMGLGVVGNVPAGRNLFWQAPRTGVAAYAIVEGVGIVGGVNPGSGMPPAHDPDAPIRMLQDAARRVAAAMPVKCALEWCDRLVPATRVACCSDLCADIQSERKANLTRLHNFLQRGANGGEESWAAEQFNEENARLSNKWAALRHEPLRGDPKYMLRGCEDDE